jgi:hypothetical protein
MEETGGRRKPGVITSTLVAFTRRLSGRIVLTVQVNPREEQMAFYDNARLRAKLALCLVAALPFTFAACGGDDDDDGGGGSATVTEVNGFGLQKATCGPGSVPETGLQGQVTRALRQPGAFTGFR